MGQLKNFDREVYGINERIFAQKAKMNVRY